LPRLGPGGSVEAQGHWTVPFSMEPDLEQEAALGLRPYMTGEGSLRMPRSAVLGLPPTAIPRSCRSWVAPGVRVGEARPAWAVAAVAVPF
jgi:hypothetical protein